MAPPGEPPGDAGAVPPSTVIRSRFRSITEHPPGTVLGRGTKRQLVDDSPHGVDGRAHRASQQLWQETPLRGGARAETMLVDTLLRPQRLFAMGTPPAANTSPSRTMLESARRDSAAKGALEALRRDAERAKFELRQVETEREREREEALQGRQQLERELLGQAKRIERLERDRRWLAEQEERLADARRTAESEMAAARQKYEARADKAAAAARDLQERLDEAVRSLRRTQSAHTDEIERYQKRLAAAERAAAELRSDNEAIQSPAQGSSSLQLTVDALRREVEEKSQDVEDLQQRLRALADTDGVAAVSTPSRTRVAQLERDLHEQCTYIQAVEQQNRQLRADTQRLATRAAKYDEEREANAALGTKVERLEQQQLTHARLEAEVDALRQEREQWRRVLRGADADSAAGQP
ncbi:hypothetical protein IWQ57_001030, partial [Coemansia nantahalensis]